MYFLCYFVQVCIVVHVCVFVEIKRFYKNVSIAKANGNVNL